MIDTPQEVLTDTEGEIPVMIPYVPPYRANYHTPACWSFYQIMASVDEPATVRCVCQRRLYTYDGYFQRGGDMAAPTMVGGEPFPVLPQSPAIELIEPDEEGEDFSYPFGAVRHDQWYKEWGEMSFRPAYEPQPAEPIL